VTAFLDKEDREREIPMTKLQIQKLFDRIRKICLALPEAKEVEAWGHPTFRAPKKMFAAIGTEKDGSASLGVKVGFDRQEKLLEDSRFFPTPYAARQGWVSLRLERKMDWAEIAALADEAYRQVAHKRLVKLLDSN
jgi:predicted DNA-binding protein (MmcQ/YjbR family)